MIAWWLLGCDPGCPPGTAADRGREGALRARLARVDAGTAAVDAAVCFGAVEDGVTGRVVSLGPGDDDERAARLGHLLHHVRDGLPAPAPGPRCAAARDALVAAERRAHDAEARYRAAFGLPAAPDRVDGLAAAYAARCAQPARTTR